MSLIPSKKVEPVSPKQEEVKPEAVKPGWKVVSHPYAFRFEDKIFKPNDEGYYFPKTEAELKEFEHLARKGFVQYIAE